MTTIKEIIKGLHQYDEAMCAGPWEVGKYNDKRRINRFIATSANSSYAPGAWMAQAVFPTDAKGIVWLRNHAGVIADALSQSAYPTYAAWENEREGLKAEVARLKELVLCQKKVVDDLKGAIEKHGLEVNIQW